MPLPTLSVGKNIKNLRKLEVRNPIRRNHSSSSLHHHLPSDLYKSGVAPFMLVLQCYRAHTCPFKLNNNNRISPMQEAEKRIPQQRALSESKLLKLCRSDLRSLLILTVEWIADRPILGTLHRSLHKVVVDFLLDKDA